MISPETQSCRRANGVRTITVIRVGPAIVLAGGGELFYEQTTTRIMEDNSRRI